MIAGATQALERRARRPFFPVNFGVSERLPEEAFVEDDEEVMHEAPLLKGGDDAAEEDSAVREDQLRQLLERSGV